MCLYLCLFEALKLAVFHFSQIVTIYYRKYSHSVLFSNLNNSGTSKDILINEIPISWFFHALFNEISFK